MKASLDLSVGKGSRSQNLRPRVSVCMAAYNGDRYIHEQIKSILPQLGQQDELVIIDDASSDQTNERIIEFRDPRIRLIRHSKNQGVVATFEEAVKCATGEILFLCDGDDVWAPEKVNRILRAFADNPGAQVAATGLLLINGEGETLDSENYLRNRRFSAALFPNLLRNRFQGSAMAFRSSLLPIILPFPKGRAFLHDAWIGTCNIVTGGGTIYLDDPLLYYRRHQNNFSRKLRFRTQVTARAQLLFALAARWLRTRVFYD